MGEKGKRCRAAAAGRLVDERIVRKPQGKKEVRKGKGKVMGEIGLIGNMGDELNEAKTRLYISEKEKKWMTKIARVLSNG